MLFCSIYREVASQTIVLLNTFSMKTFNKKKYLLIPAIALATLMTASTVSAHGFGGFMMGKASPEEMVTQWEQRLTQDAALLGISLDEMKSKWAEGKNLEEIALEKDMTKEQLQAKIKSAREEQHKAFLNTLVSQGKLTQAQADAHIKVMSQKQQNKAGKMMGRGMHRGMMKSEVKIQ